MNSSTLLTVHNRVNSGDQTTQDKDQLDEILALISEMNITDFEPHLDEDLNPADDKEGKYRTLAILRDLFEAFVSSGDSSVNVEQGSCANNCFKDCKVVNLQGNHSRKNFAFNLEKTEGTITQFHPCYGFKDKNNQPKLIDGDMMMDAFRKRASMKGEPTSQYNDRMKEMLLGAIKVFGDTKW